jgi:hypothetical protein
VKRFARLLPFIVILPLFAQDRDFSWRLRRDSNDREMTTMAAFTMAMPGLLPGYLPDSPGLWVMATFRSLVSLDAMIGQGLQPLPAISPGARFDRPVLGAGLSIVFPGLALKPCLGFAATFPLVFPANDPTAQDAVFKLLAPKGQVGIYGGIRF